MYYYGARYYDPRLSLWTSVDPLSGIAPNYSGYRYCFDNPTKFVDLLGLFETISQAKEYRAMNCIKGRIPKNEDGTYSINPIHSARFKKNNITLNQISHLNEDIIHIKTEADMEHHAFLCCGGINKSRLNPL